MNETILNKFSKRIARFPSASFYAYRENTAQEFS